MNLPLRHPPLLFTLLLGIGAPGIAVAREISFDEARSLAERAAPDVQLAGRRADVAASEVEISRTLGNPTLTVTSARQTARLGAGVSVPLPLFGQRSTGISASQADATVAGLEITVLQRDARRAATLAWIDLWEAQERARLLEQARADAERLFRTATDKFDAGTGAALDVLRTRADLARAGSEREGAKSLVAAASARLGLLLDADPDQALVARGDPGYRAPPAALPGLAAQLSDHPELRRDRAQQLAAEAHVRHQERQRWPIVNAQLTVNALDPTLTGPDLIAGLSFELPVLSLNAGLIARARAQGALAQATAAVDQRRLAAELRDGYRRTEGATARLRALQDEVLPAMESARKMTQDGYQLGRLDLLRVLEAQRALVESRLAEVDARSALGRAQADLERALGHDLAGGDHAP